MWWLDALVAGLGSLLAYYQTDEEWMSGFNFRWWNLELNDVSKLLNECSRFNFLKHLCTPHSNIEFLNNQRCFDQSFNVTKVYKLQLKTVNNEHYVFRRTKDPYIFLFVFLCLPILSLPTYTVTNRSLWIVYYCNPKNRKVSEEFKNQAFAKLY